MQQVSCEALDEAYTVFAAGMEREESQWGTVFEFVFFTEFGLINISRRDIRTGNDVDVTDRTMMLIGMLKGPYADTIIRAYKHKRYSFMGKLRVAAMRPLYWVAFMSAFLIAIVKDLFE